MDGVAVERSALEIEWRTSGQELTGSARHPSLERRDNDQIAHGCQRPIEVTRARQVPLGASTTTSSPTFAPISAFPSGESGETPPTLEISTSIVSPSSRSMVTREPTET